MVFETDLQTAARDNTDFRRVLYTGKSQLVVMSLPAGEHIGEETHPTIDQTFVIVEGVARATVAGEPLLVASGHALVVPAGTRHDIANDGPSALKLFTVYAPPAHPHGTVHATKRDAVHAELAAAR